MVRFLLGPDSQQPSQCRDEVAAGGIHNHLRKQRGTIVLHAGNLESQCQEAGISGKADISRLHPAAGGQSIDSVSEPILGDVAINERVAGDGGIAEDKEQAQADGNGGEKEEVSPVAADDFAHLSNVTFAGASLCDSSHPSIEPSTDVLGYRNFVASRLGS